MRNLLSKEEIADYLFKEYNVLIRPNGLLLADYMRMNILIKYKELRDSIGYKYHTLKYIRKLFQSGVPTDREKYLAKLRDQEVEVLLNSNILV